MRLILRDAAQPEMIAVAHRSADRDVKPGWREREHDSPYSHAARALLRLACAHPAEALHPASGPTESSIASPANRKIGLGVMGVAECLIRLGVAYDGDVACARVERLIGLIAAEAREASRRLASGRGAFPNWERSVYATRGERIRNATRPSIAPTGTISIIAGTSGGIEPLFALAYRRRRGLGGDPLVEVSPVLLLALDTLGIDAERVAWPCPRRRPPRRSPGRARRGPPSVRHRHRESPSPIARRSCHSGARKQRGKTERGVRTLPGLRSWTTRPAGVRRRSPAGDDPGVDG